MEHIISSKIITDRNLRNPKIPIFPVKAYPPSPLPEYFVNLNRPDAKHLHYATVFLYRNHQWQESHSILSPPHLGWLCLCSCSTAIPLSGCFLLDAVWGDHALPDAGGGLQQIHKEVAFLCIARLWLVELKNVLQKICIMFSTCSTQEFPYSPL